MRPSHLNIPTLNKKAKIWRQIKRKFAQHLYLTRFLLLSFIVGLLTLLASLLLPSSVRFLSRVFKTSLLSSSQTLQDLKSTDNRVNLLLLGAGGEKHQGADLTDTIIFFSIDLDGEDALMLSLPRDIWIPSLRAKLNSTYHYGEEKKPGGGLILASAAVSEILAQPIHYTLLLNFEGFIKAVDLLGGLEINVARAFDDFKYPIPGLEDAEPEEARYEHLHFDAGPQYMNGERALKYVRSRYAEGEEGTDFARSQRQQNLLLALKDKLFSSQTLLNPQKIPQLASVFKDHVDTNIRQEDYLPFLTLFLKFEKKDLRMFVLNGTDEPDGLLLNPPQSQKYDYQWVLVPRTGDWQQVQEYVASLIKKSLI